MAANRRQLTMKTSSQDRHPDPASGLGQGLGVGFHLESGVRVMARTPEQTAELRSLRNKRGRLLKALEVVDRELARYSWQDQAGRALQEEQMGSVGDAWRARIRVASASALRRRADGMAGGAVEVALTKMGINSLDGLSKAQRTHIYETAFRSLCERMGTHVSTAIAFVEAMRTLRELAAAQIGQEAADKLFAEMMRDMGLEGDEGFPKQDEAIGASRTRPRLLNSPGGDGKS